MGCPHETYFYRGRKLLACACFCQTCHNGRECVCEQCSHDPNVHIEPGYYNRIQKEDRVKYGQPEHVCKECRTEVFRKSNRGRYPVRCEDCKSKR